MRKKNGFATSSILLGIFILFLFLIVFILAILQTRYINLKRISDSAKQTTNFSKNYDFSFEYTGNYQQFIVPRTGYYNIQLWGAEGGETGLYGGGKGGYTSGNIFLSKGEKLYIYNGGKPNSLTGGYNGGGYVNNGSFGSSGGGATDIRLIPGTWNDSASLRSRIMVAGGGGGAGNRGEGYGDGNGGGGGLFGQNGESVNATNGYGNWPGIGGSQSTGGSVIQNNGTRVITASEIQTATGGFGYGARTTNTVAGAAGGGGGYYGGGGFAHAGAGGGSSYISGYAGVNSILKDGGTAAQPLQSNNTIHYSGKYFIDNQIKSNVNVGNGKTVISYVGYKEPERINTKLNNVRYIKSCLNGSSANQYSHWVEIQAIKNGINVAKNKTISGSLVNMNQTNDGDITTTNYGYVSGAQCITIDLGQKFDLDEIALWLYWGDGRIYYNNNLSVGENNVSGTATLANVLHSYTGTDGYPETSDGKRYNVWNNTIDFKYTGSYQEYIVPKTGYYNIELWGAQGYTGTNLYGKGGYTSGMTFLNQNEKIYFYLGQGKSAIPNTTSFNGGTGDNGGYPGGGASDVRLTSGNWNDKNGLLNRMMVAGGGGSGGGNNSGIKGNGGGLLGVKGGGTDGGTQLIPGNRESTSYGLSYFGIANGGCAGGNGWYPGGGATCASGAGGGSSFISGYAGVNATTNNQTITHTYNTNHFSNKFFLNGKMQSGISLGNGRATINYFGSDEPKRTNTRISNVRYIKSCINGSSANVGDYWVELQAIKNGINIAKGKTVIGTSTELASYPYSRITDGDINTAVYSGSSLNGLQCITIDLGTIYDLDEIGLWLYWGDGRVFYNNILSAGPSNISGTGSLANVIHSYSSTTGYRETSEGRRYSAWD